MSRVRANIAANIGGQSWQILLAIVCTPFYIKLLGIEAYGLIAFYIVLQNLTQILDLGLGTTVNREVARLSGKVGPADKSALTRLVGTIERWYWMLGCILGVALFFAVPHIASWWLQPGQLAQEDLIDSARIIGLMAFLQWPSAFYQSGLLGLQRQVVLNAIQAPFSGLSSIGGLAFIWLGPRSVSALLTWQAGIALIQLCVVYVYFWKHIGVQRASTRVDLAILRGHWRFSLGMSGIFITGLILTHLDKLILSRLLTLESFGHYCLAGTLAKGLYVLITPVFNAYFPRFSALVSDDNKDSMRVSYHTATQLMAVLIFPLAAIITLFSQEIALAWLHNAKIAAEVAPIASLLVVGICLNGLMNLPFALQLAYGKTAISLYTNTFLVVVLVPAIIVATLSYGALGAATTWAFANGLYVAVGVPITHKYLLVGEAKNWLRLDIIPPLLVSVIIVGLGRILIPHELPVIHFLLLLAPLWGFATLCAALSVGKIRNWGRLFI